MDGDNFDEETLALVIYSKPESKATGRNLWDNTDEVKENAKKRLTFLPKLKGKIVNMDEDSKVVGYLSGHNKSTFVCYILDGMYAMECEEQKVRSNRKG